METLPDVVARERRSDADALWAPIGRRQVYTYHRLCTTAWQTGNFLRHLGVRAGSRVAVADEPAAQTVLTLFGTALLEGVTWIGAPRDATERGSATDGGRDPDAALRAVVAPVDAVEEYDLPEGGQRAGYGGEPADPSTYHFEEQVWSENPTRVPTEYDPADPVLTDGDREYSHRDLLDAARETIETHDLGEGDVVAVESSLAAPAVIAAGVLAPLVAGATVVLGGRAEVDDDPDGVATSPEPTLVVDEETATATTDLP